MRDSWLAVVMLLLVGCGESRSPGGAAGESAGRSGAAGSAGRQGAEGGSGAMAAPGGTGAAGRSAAGSGDQWTDMCEPHRSTTSAFLAAHRDCAVDADCTVVGSCSGGFGFAAVSASAAEQAQALSDATPNGCGAFDGPQYRAVCERAGSDSAAGQCALREQGRACGEAAPELCDGSDDIRLGFMLGGGFVPSSYQFTNPYGIVFAAIDGHCRYYASRNYMEGTYSSTLTADEAAQLADDLGFDRIDSWAGHHGKNCPDAGGVTLATTTAALTCVCGCDGAPAGAAEAIQRLSEWAARLIEQGGPLDGAVSALAEPSSAVLPSSMVRAWPLAQPLTHYPGLITDSQTGSGPVARFEQAADAKSLRDLRNATFAADATLQSILVNDGSGTGNYQLYVRDELPSDRATAIRDFFDAAQKRQPPAQ